MKAIIALYTAALALAPAARTASVNGLTVDLANQRENLVEVQVGTITDGAHSVALYESSDNSTFTAVAAADQVGTFVPLVSTTTQKVGYIGSKRYIRLQTTVTGATTGGVYGATVLTRGRHQPQ